VGLAKELQALTADILPALEELPVIATYSMTHSRLEALALARRRHLI